MKTVHRLSLLASAALMTYAQQAYSAEPARILPVAAVIEDLRNTSTLDPEYKALVTAGLSQKTGPSFASGLKASFGARAVSGANNQTAGNTFSATMHVTRARSYEVIKGNGNSDLIASVTAGLYFTNIRTGEILMTVSRSAVSQAVVPTGSDLSAEKRKLFTAAVDSLVKTLATDGPAQFNPVVVEATVSDRVSEYLVLDGGYAQGVQLNDRFEGAGDQLVDIVYAGEKYAIAKSLFPSNISVGTAFQKFMAHPASGKDRPSVAVVLDGAPSGVSEEYLSRVFAEVLGDAAPVTLIQSDTNYTQMMSTIRSQEGVEISSLETANRPAPRYVVRLNVREPIAWEADTNLPYVKQRGYETLVFADLIDNTGRVVFSASGKDKIVDKVVNGVGVAPAERRDVNIKNAIHDLAKQFSKISELKRERTIVSGSTDAGLAINSEGKVFANSQQGYILRPMTLKVGSAAASVLVPIAEASVSEFAGKAATPLALGLPITEGSFKATSDTVFEVSRIGTQPKSHKSFSMCGPVEHFGAVATPNLMALSSLAMSTAMPGAFYVPNIRTLTDKTLTRASGFDPFMTRPVTQADFCIQPVDRVLLADEVCKDQCERPITATYTLRLKQGESVLSRTAFEGKFTSTGFYKSTSSENLKGVFEADVVDEAKQLLDKAAQKLTLPLQ
ncbi:hypothetical protein [Rhodoferax mekongensis]|uniref:Uncharacterized protein n=1 Tax=Rhodoferax mekongensis TaxID=3068341 RepID=A0ABZ0AUU0_9BURK|nr:hypothetical protein [Rhodoferax sp. TBRC 17307]WNO03389.1 hypothetical protein RAN89_10660 [Rhodoferax sp. TBRC 17307]